jgi:hypothetical protein
MALVSPLPPFVFRAGRCIWVDFVSAAVLAILPTLESLARNAAKTLGLERDVQLLFGLLSSAYGHDQRVLTVMDASMSRVSLNLSCWVHGSIAGRPPNM